MDSAFSILNFLDKKVWMIISALYHHIGNPTKTTSYHRYKILPQTKENTS